MEHLYRAYGLLVSSAIEIPEFLPAGAMEGAEPDVSIAFGSVPEALDPRDTEGILFQATDDAFIMHVEKVAGYQAVEGKRILVEPRPDSSPGDVRVFLLGSVFGALLQQRGLLPLHAGAVETSSGAILFAGPSGHGKSTLTAVFAARGHRVLCDDVCVLDVDGEGRATAWPSFPQIKLWTDSARLVGKDVTTLRRIRPTREKYAVPVADGFNAEPLRVAAIYDLFPRATAGIVLEPLDGHERFSSVVHNTYRRGFLGKRLRAHNFQMAAKIASTVRIVRIKRPLFPLQTDELVRLVEEDLARNS